MYSSLHDLIYCLTREAKLHIGVLFFGNWGNEKTVLPQQYKIHASPFCEGMKKTTEGFAVCYRHRNAAVKRALDTGKSFCAVCPNGLFEYTHPVEIGGEVAALVFVGNICPQGEAGALLAARLGEHVALAPTVAQDVDAATAERYARVVESYIRVLLARGGQDGTRDGAPLVENVKNYIAENAAYKLDLHALAALFHYNEKYLGRLFKRQTGESLSAYLNRLRVANAAELLAGGKESVIEIAARAGFSSVNYFNRVFKDHYGLSPTAYREKARKSTSGLAIRGERE
ncbi:MAG: helix-turn-helix domain-containing protein [Clostridia bacterium]|nr:helix-turn-helix domain-containing protein [Clostridia bacterium]